MAGTRRTPPKATRQRDPERTRERILDAALAEFAAKGYAGARVNEIADRAGVNKQLISYYFGGKAGLYDALLGRWQEIEEEIIGGQGEQSLAELTSGYVARRPQERDFARLLAWEGLSVAADEAETTRATEHRTTRMPAAVAEIERRRQAGELAADIDPRAFLLAFMAAANAVAALPQMARAIFGADPNTEEFAQAYADQLARMIRRLAEPDH
ncbi:DNA-binding transcriptional regulator, AcrR family [Actinopolymorpha cephalotaxi]|uniref:AcrR family transcriptional regulator n=1 Tax=Actinopolymorpha cephalotaxi TaxID=504797 RepID=A0A1I2UPC1_9ACTN|nr:TetR/AcrR family transcriptional regulator [Actinopolymorpha cephalotaxi]NYH86677.1 AcrR family transcriptional regulator [Actinopolymorpha cephalotaxi]SFG78908.1 DNA-binding transcriptional regulator, AcrR family [Actinopolymorpha cephalotaxi]